VKENKALKKILEGFAIWLILTLVLLIPSALLQNWKNWDGTCQTLVPPMCNSLFWAGGAALLLTLTCLSEWGVRFTILATFFTVASMIALAAFPIFKKEWGLIGVAGVSFSIALATKFLGNKIFKGAVFFLLFFAIAVPLCGTCVLVAQVVGYPITLFLKLCGTSWGTAMRVTAICGAAFGLTGAWCIATPLWERVTEDW
jgi:hypothetical protein